MNNNLIFGYDLLDYIDIFSLTDDDLKTKILEIPDRFSSFTLECNTKGGKSYCFSELFNLSKSELNDLLTKKINDSERDISKVLDNSILTKQEIIQKHKNILEKFLLEYSKLYDDQIYISGAIASLPFEDLTFDLALCCRNLFGMSPSSNLTRDLQVISELLRVASRVKIFPLNDLDAKPCEYIGDVMMYFQDLGYRIEVVNVNDRLIGRHNATLCLWNTECKL